jgi:hypothetical protein
MLAFVMENERSNCENDLLGQQGEHDDWCSCSGSFGGLTRQVCAQPERTGHSTFVYDLDEEFDPPVLAARDAGGASTIGRERQPAEQWPADPRPSPLINNRSGALYSRPARRQDAPSEADVAVRHSTRSAEHRRPDARTAGHRFRNASGPTRLRSDPTGTPCSPSRSRSRARTRSGCF